MNIKKLKDCIQSAHINFLFGSGLSRPYLSTLGKIETFMALASMHPNKDERKLIIASLYAYKLTEDDKYLEIYKKANDWTFEHFVDPLYPEWYGYLHRDGTVAQPAKGNLFKGPFHIPRMLVLCHLLCNNIIS